MKLCIYRTIISIWECNFGLTRLLYTCIIPPYFNCTSCCFRGWYVDGDRLIPVSLVLWSGVCLGIVLLGPVFLPHSGLGFLSERLEH